MLKVGLKFFFHIRTSRVLFYFHVGQWSVTNPTGKKVYSILFLLQLGSEAVCQKKPDVLRNWSNLTPQFNLLSVSF